MTRSLTQKITSGAFVFLSLITIAVIVAIWSLVAIRDAQHHLTEDVLQWSQTSDTFSSHLNRAVAEAITFGYSGLDEDRQEAQAALDAARASLSNVEEQAHDYAEAYDPAEYDRLYQRQVDLLNTTQTHIEQLLSASATGAATDETVEALEALEEDIDRLTADTGAFLDANVDESTSVVRTVIRYMFAIAGISWSSLGLVIMLGLIMLRRRIVQPIATLSTAADAVASGDLAQNVSVTNNDEIGTLQRSFNSMVRSLQQQTHALQQERAALKKEIAERKQAEAALRRSEASLAMAQRIAHLGNWEWDIVTDELYWSDEVYRLCGFAPHQDTPTYERFMALAHPEDRKFIERSLHAALCEGKKYGIDFRLVLADGSERVVHAQSEVIYDGGTPIKMIGTLHDITERKRLDRMKNEFISTVSHELRTPLTSIRGSLGLIAGGIAGELPARAKAMIDIAYNNSERLVRLINDILDIEKIESGKMVFNLKPLDLRVLIAQAIEANRAYGEQFRVTFALDGSARHVTVMADSDRLMQVLTNLLSNAAKFSPPDGTVHMSVSQQGSIVRVSVTDHGPGIPEEFRIRIFQKFAQADSSDTRQKGGTGLGLSITRAIVEKHGGHVGFDTTAGVGTTFFFDLPVWQAPQLAASDDRPQASDAARILICEDDRDIATLLSLVLDQGGFQTDIAYDAAQAKRLLEQHTYAGMTLDMLLPDQDGIALVRELRAQERTRELPILVVSAKTASNYQELNAEAFGIVDWLEKPIDTSRLMDAVQRTVQRLADSPCRILHVEDDPDVAQVIAAVLQNVAEVSGAASLAEAKHRLARETFDLVLLDIGLPDGSGLDLSPMVTNGSNPPVPVIIFSAQDISNELSQQVSAVLVKSRTNNQQFLDTVMALITCHHMPVDVSVPTSEGT